MEAKWSRESIVRWILDRDIQGLGVLAKEARVYNSYMYRSAVSAFGSWVGALSAAGIKIHKGNRPINSWTPKKVESAILRIAKNPESLCYTIVHRKHRRLYEAARLYFGSWYSALFAVGIDPLSVRKLHRWDKPAVIEAILACAIRNDPLAVTRVRPRSIAHWGIRLFGSWQSALLAAGLDPMKYIHARRQNSNQPAPDHKITIQKRSIIKWSRERIAEELHIRFRAGKAMTISRIRHEDRRLYNAIRHYFENWADAMRFAELDPEAHRVLAYSTRVVRTSGEVDHPDCQ